MRDRKKFEEYKMKKVHKTKNTHAVFFNTVDPIVRKKEEEFLIGGEILNKKYDQDDSVRYYFNSLGYRSDEFTEFHDGEHILFAGCSETEGWGGNLDSCWSHMVYKKLSETKKISGFFNLSRAGWGHDVIIANIIEYIKTYGKPSKIYILFPNFSRSFNWSGWDNEQEIYEYIVKTNYYSPNDVVLPSGKLVERQGLKEQRESIVKFINLVKLFEEYCISNNIKLMWSTYVPEDEENYNNLKVFKNFIKMSDTKESILNSDHILSKAKNKEKNLLIKRDGHSGYFYHYWWSQRFLGLIDTDSV